MRRRESDLALLQKDFQERARNLEKLEAVQRELSATSEDRQVFSYFFFSGAYVRTFFAGPRVAAA